MPTYAHTNRVRAAGRYGLPLLGSRQAAGGLLEDLPVDLLTQREWVTYFNDFKTAADFGDVITGDDTTPDWTVTDIGTVTTGTVGIATDTQNGVLQIIPDATDNEGYHVQLTGTDTAGEIWRPASGRIIACEFRFGVGDADDQDYFVGLAEVSATLMSSAGALTSDNFVGFRHLQSVGNGILRCIAAGTDTTNQTDYGAANTTALSNSTAPATTQANFVRAGFRIIGTNQVDFYLNGQRVQTATLGTAFDDNMTISFANVGSGAATDAMYIDYVMVAQTR